MLQATEYVRCNTVSESRSQEAMQFPQRSVSISHSRGAHTRLESTLPKQPEDAGLALLVTPTEPPPPLLTGGLLASPGSLPTPASPSHILPGPAQWGSLGHKIAPHWSPIPRLVTQDLLLVPLHRHQSGFLKTHKLLPPLPPFPLGIHTFVLYVCVSISTLLNALW